MASFFFCSAVDSPGTRYHLFRSRWCGIDLRRYFKRHRTCETAGVICGSSLVLDSGRASSAETGDSRMLVMRRMPSITYLRIAFPTTLVEIYLRILGF